MTGRRTACKDPGKELSQAERKEVQVCMSHVLDKGQKSGSPRRRVWVELRQLGTNQNMQSPYDQTRNLNFMQGKGII